MIFLAILAVCLSATSAATPASGTCLCSTASSLNVRSAAGTSHSVIGHVNRGECFIFHGGILTRDGYTWYELQNVHGHSRAWAASRYLQSSAHSSCSGGGSSSGSGSSGFATGLVSQQCLDCICMHESGCRPLGCRWDVSSNSCGYFQIKNAYYTDCHKPGSSWQSCSADKQCSSQCVQAYMTRYIDHYGCPRTCQSYARNHNGGPQGCKHDNTRDYWAGVKRHAGCHNLV